MYYPDVQASIRGVWPLCVRALRTSFSCLPDVIAAIVCIFIPKSPEPWLELTEAEFMTSTMACRLSLSPFAAPKKMIQPFCVSCPEKYFIMLHEHGLPLWLITEKDFFAVHTP